MGFAKLKALAGTTVLLVTLGFGLYPFNFFSENDVAFEANAPAIRFHGKADQKNYAQQGIAYTSGAIPFPGNQPLSILIEAFPAEVPDGLGTLLEIHDGKSQPPLIVAQWREHLVIRSRRLNKPSGRAYQEIGLSNGLPLNKWVSLVINYTGAETRVYKDGKLEIERRGYQLLEKEQPLTAHVVIGNSASGESPWIGSLKRVALFDSDFHPSSSIQDPMIEYVFDEPFSESVLSSGTLALELFIPSQFNPLEPKRFAPLSSFRRHADWQASDITINFFGFLPCSIVVFFYFYRRTRLVWLLPLYTAAGASTLSFLIEFSQIVLPSRNPSYVDLAVNSLAGLVAGTTLFLSSLVMKRNRGAPRFSLPVD